MFKAILKPIDDMTHNVGCMIFLDIKVDYNDCSPISTDYGYTGISEIFFTPGIPSVWRTYEYEFPPEPTDIVATGILVGHETSSNPPDVFWYGSALYSSFAWADSEWTSVTGNEFGDSGIMVKWYLQNVTPAIL